MSELITPKDVRDITFRTAFIGYNADDVDDFLNGVDYTLTQLTDLLEGRTTIYDTPDLLRKVRTYHNMLNVGKRITKKRKHHGKRSIR